ncbi:MAG TPA: heparinase II/III family protein [Xanthobacteraceae bacterium]|nr:heparinase II/III family protein [Xanthobacteraceae bacterium]
MSRGLIAERARLSVFVARRGVRLLYGSISAHPLLRWRFVSTSTDRLLIAPQDLRTADPTRASELYAGRYAFAGKIVICDGRSPFVLTPPSMEWTENLASFGWLRQLRAAESGITRAHARSLVNDWITEQGRWDPVAWRPDVVARRIISWLTHAPFLLHEADMRFYRRFLRSLTRQVRYLRRASGNLRDGLPRLQAAIALTFAALCMAGQLRLLKPVGTRLIGELDRQILPDGGHVSRNPGVLTDLLLDLLPLRQAFAARNMVPPEALTNAIDRMMPMLRFFRHGDGTFAHFNGMGPTAPDLLATVLAYDDARGKPVANAVHSGYQRLEAGGVVLLMDTGCPPPLPLSHEAHAGCLSIELSAGRNRIVLNCGMPSTSRDSWRYAARMTAAHSTVTVNQTCSCRFLAAGALQRMLGAPILDGPTEVLVWREEDAEGSKLRAVHNGYAARFGMLHERTVLLAVDGRRLDGEDTILPARGRELRSHSSDQFVLRFHLHPSVRANRLTHRHGVMLTLPNRDIWTFEAYEHEVEIEDSAYLGAAEGPRHTSQIVIYGEARKTPRIAWSFVQVDPAEARSFQRATEESELAR